MYVFIQFNVQAVGLSGLIGFIKILPCVSDGLSPLSEARHTGRSGSIRTNLLFLEWRITRVHGLPVRLLCIFFLGC